MGNEVSRPAEDLSPQSSGVVPPRSPYTPTGGASRRAQSFNSPSPGASQPAPRRVSSSSASLSLSNPRKERTIQRMDKAIRRRVRGGITYNMKLLIRGARGTGKTSLFQRLQGQPIPDTHQPTPQLQAATISWSFRQHLEENVKCEVWDVVDRGFVPADAAEGADGLSAQAVEAVAAAAAAVQNGTHAVAVVDASTVDVYQEAHGVIFLLDVTKWDTLEYVKQQLDSVPVHIPTLVLGNFRDLGAQRKIFKEDVEELLYGSSDRPQQQWRRPTELLYFECSLLDCYGLKSLHQYFGIPFLQLKLATIRQQMRIVEGEFAHLKHDVQATISEQRYAEYVEHIKVTGSDIRTGRRGSGNGNTPPAVSRTDSVRISPRSSSQTTPTSQQEGGDDDVSVVSKRDAAGTPPKPASEVAAATAATTSAQQVQESPQVVDTEDLPARNSSAVIQAAPPLKFEHRESAAAIPDNAVEATSVNVEEKPVSPVGRSGDTPAATKRSPSRLQKASIEEVIHLEDFQVPKARMSDLDHFYSEDESDEEAGDYDEDVVVAPVDGAKKASIAGVYHKQRFLDSDSSDSDESETATTQSRRKTNAPHRRSPRNAAVKQSSTTGQQMPRPPASSSPSPPSPHPPKTLSRPTQRSRSGSPARVQPAKECQDVLSQQQSSSPISGAPVSVTPTPPASPPTSPSTSSIRHSSPRNKSEITTTTPQSETRQYVSPTQGDENEVKRDASTGEEPELTGTEDAAVPIDQNEQELTDEISTQQSPKHFDDNTLASSKQVDDEHVSALVGDAEEASNGAPTETEESELPGSLGVTTPTATSTEVDAKHEPKDVSQGSTYDEEDTSIKEADRGAVDGEGEEEDVGMDGNSNELSSFLADENDSDEENDTPEALEAERTVADDPVPLVASSVARRPDVLMSDEESESNDDNRGGSSSVLLSSEALNQGAPHQDQSMGNFHKRNLDGAGDLQSLSVLQASLPMPGKSAALLSSTSHGSAGVTRNEGVNESALHASDLQAAPSTAPMPDFSTVVPRNDLEAFLNESGSDSEDAAPPSYVEPSSKRTKSGRRAVVESSDDEDEEDDQNRFASYSISKKGRSERRRQQKEDLRQLNAMLDNSSGQDGVRSEPFTPSATGVAALGTSSDVMEAIRKAQEEAMRMLPTADDDADSSSSKKRHMHKHKKEHKHKKRETEDSPKEKSARKSSRKSGSNSRSKKRRPHVADDVE
ncbi:hypothetical protein PR003_g17710 [Phytophthora rubi]|uniref:GTP-binding protein Parf n=1 Tax=Phytophthora rubi TaxID=129364 RepID=A0A6A4EBR7_9STRA|nr:hypothetical protein PR002_g19877 [Phytophthora rubi]KAE9007529.1 hypothetical protein PR001_g16949 [Phytophthora rubi]KAE9320461.1 hypothetical protein PR003_g17710 [Phytophthora rubi]